MRIALPIWNGRIAPVLDVACRFLLVDVECGAESGRSLTSLVRRPEEDGGAGLSELGVDVLVCGAISRRLESEIRCRGISVTAFVAGQADAVLGACLCGRLSSDAYAMPGCARRRRRGFGGCRGRMRGRGRQAPPA